MAVEPAPDAIWDAFLKCEDQAALASVLGVNLTWLTDTLYGGRPRYRTFIIPKKSGGSRYISVPKWRIRLLQDRLLPLLIRAYSPKSVVHGFVKERSVVTNASVHMGRALVLNIDLLNFFPSIHFGRVRGTFQKPPFGFNNAVSSTLAHLCTMRISGDAAALPQGAPTSPVLSNLVCRRLDNAMWKFVEKHQCRYTRYADDITISSNKTVFPTAIVNHIESTSGIVVLGDDILAILARNGFHEHAGKTRVRDRHRRQEVTGLIVNRKANVKRRYVRRIRAIIRNWKVCGMASADAEFAIRDAERSTRGGRRPSIRSHLIGKLEFLRMVRGRGDVLAAKYYLQAAALPGFKASAVIEGSAAAEADLLRSTLWVIQGVDDQGMEICQGTAFQVRGVGFVTAQHVIADPPFPVEVWRLVRGEAPYDEYPIYGYRSISGIDLAVLDTNAFSNGQLLLGEGAPQIGDDALAAGFPNWHSYGDTPIHAPTEVIQLKPISGSTHMSVGVQLVSGASGGPLLNSNGHVIGVIVRNKDDHTMPNSAIDLSRLSEVAAAPSVALI